MPYYDFRCPQHGVFEQRLSSDGCLDASLCSICGDYSRRVYSAQRIIVRPRGYNLRPGEYAGNGLGYSHFDYELERGDLREDASGAYTPESRAKREAEIAATDVYQPRPMAEIDRDIAPQMHQELHEWARVVHRQVTEEDA